MSKAKFPDFLKLEKDLRIVDPPLGHPLMNAQPPEMQPARFNPPPRPTAEVLHVVKTFGELPTKEIDDLIEAAENEIAELKREAQGVRNLYTEYTTRITEDIKRLQLGVAASLKTMQELREHCAKLNEPLNLKAEPSTEPPPAA